MVEFAILGPLEVLDQIVRRAELWQEARSPYESARVRMALGTAFDRAGQPEAGRLELATARACFDRLGARLERVRS